MGASVAPCERVIEMSEQWRGGAVPVRPVAGRAHAVPRSLLTRRAPSCAVWCVPAFPNTHVSTISL